MKRDLPERTFEFARRVVELCKMMKNKMLAATIVALFANTGATMAQPIIIDPNTGEYLGNLNSNPYDPNSVSNPYGKYGSPYSEDSVNNPYVSPSPYDGMYDGNK